jgi:hypothetical protein
MKYRTVWSYKVGEGKEAEGMDQEVMLWEELVR